MCISEYEPSPPSHHNSTRLTMPVPSPTLSSTSPSFLASFDIRSLALAHHRTEGATKITTTGRQTFTARIPAISVPETP